MFNTPSHEAAHNLESEPSLNRSYSISANKNQKFGDKFDDPENFCNTFWNKLHELDTYSRDVFDFTREFYQILHVFQSYYTPFLAANKDALDKLNKLEKKYSSKNFECMGMLVKKVKCYTSAINSELKMLNNQCQNLTQYTSSLKAHITNYDKTLVPNMKIMKLELFDRNERLNNTYNDYYRNALALEKTFVEKKVESYNKCFNYGKINLNAQPKEQLTKRSSTRKYVEENPEILYSNHFKLKESWNLS